MDSGETVQAARHRALADPSRLAILRVLEGAETPLDAQSLADRVGLHANTVRWHLGVLADAALVTEAHESSGERGRPRHGFRIVPGALAEHPGGFPLLADAFADVLFRSGDPRTIEAVGRERGAALVADDTGPKPRSAASSVGTVVRMLERFGFQPRLRRGRAGRRIEMRPCPFGETAVNFQAVVCPLHLGLIRGALEQLGDPVEASALEPFVAPNLCVAHLTAAPRRSRPKR